MDGCGWVGGHIVAGTNAAVTEAADQLRRMAELEAASTAASIGLPACGQVHRLSVEHETLRRCVDAVGTCTCASTHLSAPGLACSASGASLGGASFCPAAASDGSLPAERLRSVESELAEIEEVLCRAEDAIEQGKRKSRASEQAAEIERLRADLDHERARRATLESAPTQEAARPCSSPCSPALETPTRPAAEPIAEHADRQPMRQPFSSPAPPARSRARTSAPASAPQSTVTSDVAPGVASRPVNRFGGGGETCAFCHRLVYAAERAAAQGKVYHRNCIRCCECGGRLGSSFCVDAEGRLYCEPHFKQHALQFGITTPEKTAA